MYRFQFMNDRNHVTGVAYWANLLLYLVNLDPHDLKEIKTSTTWRTTRWSYKKTVIAIHIGMKIQAVSSRFNKVSIKKFQSIFIPLCVRLSKRL